MNRLSVAALCLLLASGCGDSNGKDNKDSKATAGKDVVFVSGALFIAGDGTPPVEGATMIIEDGVITKIGKKGELYAPKGSLPLDLEGKTIAPLFINLHAYPGLGSFGGTFGAKNYKRESLSADLNRYGYYGVAAVLAGGDSDGLAGPMRDDIKSGKATGALLYTSGRGIANKGTSGFMGSIPILVGSDAEARKAVADLAERKVDAIVLWADGMKADVSNAVVDEAHKQKLKVFADAPGLAEAKNLAKAGVDALISSVRDHDVDDELVSAMKEKKIPLSPALTALEARFAYADNPSWLGERVMREVYPSTLSAYLKDPVIVAKFKRNPQIGTFRQEFATASKNLKKLADAGVPIALGSGSGLADTFPGYFEHRELELMVNAGMAPRDAIKAATSVSATALGANDLGSLVVGKQGSFIVFSSNPLDKITNTKDIDKIWVKGKDIDRLEMIRKIQVENVAVTPEERAKEKALQEDEQIALEDAKLTKYGKFPLGQSLPVATGLIVPTPKRSKASASSGPPYRVTVQLPKASGADLREFYTKTLTSWQAAGDCWEKANSAQPGKKWKLCAEPGNGQIILNISAQ